MRALLKSEVAEQQSHADGGEKFIQRPWDFLRADDSHAVTDEAAGHLNELLDGPGFEVVCLDDAIAGEGFVHHRCKFGIAVLDDGGGFAHLAAEDDDGDEANGKNQRYDQHELGVHFQTGQPRMPMIVTGSFTTTPASR